MRKVLAILLILFVMINNRSMANENDRIYQLNDGSNVSELDVLLFRDKIILEYNKNMNRCPPGNPDLHQYFILSQPFNSTVQLSYYGNVGLYFQESNSTYQKFTFVDRNQPLNFPGFSIFGVNTYRCMYYDDHSYGILTNISDLTDNTAIALAYTYYNYDYSRYYFENAKLSQIKQENLTKINNAAKELLTILHTGDDPESPEIIAAQLNYFNIATHCGYDDPSAMKILEDLDNKSMIIGSTNITSKRVSTSDINISTFINTPDIYTILACSYFVILGFVISKIERWKNTLVVHGKKGAAVYISDAFGLILSLGILSHSPSGMTIIHYFFIVLSISAGILLICKYE